MHLPIPMLIAAGALAAIVISPPARADEDPQLHYRLLPPEPPSDVTNDSGLDIAGNCRKVQASGLVIRKACRGTLSFERDIAPGVALKAQASLGRDRGRSSGPIDFGRPSAEFMQDYSAQVIFGSGWHIGAGYFDHGGWSARSVAEMARQMGAGGDPAHRGGTLSLGWSRSSQSGRPDSLSFTLEAFRDQEATDAYAGPSMRNGTAVRLAMATSF